MLFRRPRLLVRLACYLSLAVPILACGGGSTCIGWVQDDQGGRHAPVSGTSDRDQAQRLACNGYCVDADPQYEAMYGIWRSGPGGDPSVSKQEAMFRDDALLSYVTQTCADRCVAEVASGARAGGVDCTP